MDYQALYSIVKVIAIAFVMGVGTIAPAVSLGKAVVQAIESTARQPEAAGSIRTLLLMGAALIEAIAIYCLLIALILFYA
ncbi:MAG: ATP synthase F0 subunit C [Candidatus Riflebacteria bacterium]|nr:ATP synthase F0 subunit C [Candidatus Riflebacteria bacterium]